MDPDAFEWALVTGARRQGVIFSTVLGTSWVGFVLASAWILAREFPMVVGMILLGGLPAIALVLVVPFGAARLARRFRGFALRAVDLAFAFPGGLTIVLDRGLVLYVHGGGLSFALYADSSGSVLVPTAKEAGRWAWRGSRERIVARSRRGGKPSALGALRERLGAHAAFAAFSEARRIPRDPRRPHWTAMAGFRFAWKAPSVPGILEAVGGIQDYLTDGLRSAGAPGRPSPVAPSP